MDNGKKLYKSWDDNELNKLRRYVDAKVSIRKAAIDFDRSESSITNAAYRLRKADLEANRAIKEQQRMMEQMKKAQAQNGQPQPDPKAIAAAHATQMQAQVKAQVTQQSAAQRTAQRQVQFQQKMEQY